mgnify:CR=1 FL=1
MADRACGRIGLVFADDLVGELLFGIDVENRDGRAEADFLAVQLADIDDVSTCKLVVELADAALDKALLLLGGVVFRVLGQVAMRTSLGNGRNDAGPLNGLQHLEFSLKGSVAFGGHRYAFHREIPSSCAAKKRGFKKQSRQVGRGQVDCKARTEISCVFMLAIA